MVQSSDGGYAIVGTIGFFYPDIAVFKLTGFGELEWAKTYGGTDDDRGTTIIQTSDGGYIVGGWTRSFGAGGEYDWVVFKITSSGELEWARTYGWANYREIPYSIAQTSDGGFVVAGTATDANYWCDILVLKLSNTGDLQWGWRFGAPSGAEVAYSVTPTQDGGCAVLGGYKFVVLKFTSAGALQWARNLGTGSGLGEAPSSITQTIDGGFALAGYVSGIGAGNEDILILKLDSNGGLQWARTVGGGGSDEATSLIQTPDGSYVVGGWTYSFGPHYTNWANFLVFRVSGVGDLQWAWAFDQINDDVVSSVVQTLDGGYAVLGNSGYWSLVDLIKIAPDGSYPGCILSCSPTTTTPSINSFTPPNGTSCSPSISSPTLTVTPINLTITDLCTPIGVDGNTGMGSGIAYSPVPGGMLFNSPGSLHIRIYSPEGRLVHSGNLEKGENRILLDPGVYLWVAGKGESYPYKGKAVVR
jgi:hypothetical protein